MNFVALSATYTALIDLSVQTYDTNTINLSIGELYLKQVFLE